MSGSHPSWVCGLKRMTPSALAMRPPVTPFVGVWIETRNTITATAKYEVTPFVGVWIETNIQCV